MAKGYVIFTEDIHDPDRMGTYMANAGATIAEFGGRPIVFDGSPEVLEGEWHGPQTVVLEFDSVEAARAWYRSETYQAAIGDRHAAATSNGVIVSGLG
jgi:uncharacterized protein (DUF1330 family)